MAKKNIQNAQAIENNAIATVNEKEEVTMAENTKAIETAEATAIEEAGPKTMLLFTASRGKNTKLAWNEVVVNPDDATQKVKGCAIELPTQVAELIGNDKFVSYIDKDIIARCVGSPRYRKHGVRRVHTLLQGNRHEGRPCRSRTGSVRRGPRSNRSRYNKRCVGTP